MSRPGGLAADPVTLQTPIAWVFAGGDAFYGPKSVVEAVACGKEAAESIHRYHERHGSAGAARKPGSTSNPRRRDEPRKAGSRSAASTPRRASATFIEVS